RSPPAVRAPTPSARPPRPRGRRGPLWLLESHDPLLRLRSQGARAEREPEPPDTRPAARLGVLAVVPSGYGAGPGVAGAGGRGAAGALDTLSVVRALPLAPPRRTAGCA